MNTKNFYLMMLGVIIMPTISQAQVLDETSLDKIVSVSSVSKDCTQKGPVSIEKESQIGNDTKKEFVLGSVNFQLDCEGLMERSAYIKVYFDKVYESSSWIYRIYRDGSWKDIPKSDMTFRDEEIETLQKTKTKVSIATYEIKDGGYLDSDGMRNSFISQKLGFAQVSLNILDNPLTINDTSGKTDMDSIMLKGVCEIDSIISILNRGNVLDNKRYICSNGFLSVKLDFPKGTITKQQISVYQKTANGSGVGNPLPVSITINTPEKKEKLTDFMFRRNLKLFDIGNDVIMLQKMLNQTSFPVAKEGGGSLGQETSQLSNNTWRAVRRFQNEMGIGGEEKKVGPKTINKLKNILKAKNM